MGDVQAALKNLRLLRPRLDKRIKELQDEGNFKANEGWFRSDRYGYIQHHLKSTDCGPTGSLKKESVEDYFEKLGNPRLVEYLVFKWINEFRSEEIVQASNEEPVSTYDLTLPLKTKNIRTGNGLDGLGYAFLKPYSTLYHFLARTFNEISDPADLPKAKNWDEQF